MKVRLNIGLDYQGQVYRDCAVNLLTMGGQCTAQEIIADLGIDENSEQLSAKDKTLVDMAYLSQQVEVDGIDKADVTAEFLFKHLVTDDYWQLIEATLALRKKRLENGENHGENPSPTNQN